MSEVVEWGVSEIGPLDSEKKAIFFRCHRSSPQGFDATSTDIERENVITYIENGEGFVTLVDSKKGAPIHYTSAGYLRTNANEELEDNLESLPTCRFKRTQL